MTRLFVPAFILFLFTLSPVLSYAGDFETGSEITAVTVYSNRAKVERRAVIDVPHGAHNIIFTDVPQGMLPDSLRAQGFANEDVTIGALSHKKHFKTELVSERERELQTKLQTFVDQLQVINAENAALEAQEEFLKNLGKQAALRSDEDIAEIDLKPEQWITVSETLRTGLAETLGKKLVNGRRSRELNKEIERLNNEIAQLKTGSKESWRVVVPIEAAAATKLTLDISYQMQQATWRPVYDARLDTETGKLELVQYGEVQQQTGEDWSNVALSLSTAQPQRGAALPQPQPMWVNIYQQGQRRGLTQAYQESAIPTPVESPVDRLRVPEADKPGSSAFRKAGFNYAQIHTGGYVTEYKISGPSTIPADGSGTKLLIGAFEADSELQIHVQPQKSNHAYLVAHMTLEGDTPLLPGTVNLFRDGAFIGQHSLPLLRPDEEQDLSFGIDDQISVKRETLKDERGADGVLSRDNVQERRFITGIQNLHNEPVKVFVMETIPVARNEKIDIEILKDFTTGGYKTDRDNIKGLTWWEIQLIPKEKKEVKLGWKVTWPRDFSINGI